MLKNLAELASWLPYKPLIESGRLIPLKKLKLIKKRKKDIDIDINIKKEVSETRIIKKEIVKKHIVKDSIVKRQMIEHSSDSYVEFDSESEFPILQQKPAITDYYIEDVPDIIDEVVSGLKFGVQPGLGKMLMKNSNLRNFVFEVGQQFMESGASMTHGVFRVKSGHAYFMANQYTAPKLVEFAKKKNLPQIQLGLLASTLGTPSFAMTDEGQYVHRNYPVFVDPNTGMAEIPYEALKYLIDPSYREEGEDFKHGYLLNADRIKLHIPKPMTMEFGDRVMDVLPVEATTMWLEHTLFGELLHIVVYDRNNGKLYHYWFGLGKAPTAFQRDVVSLQDKVNEAVPLMWLGAAQNLNFLAQNMKQMNISSLENFNGFIQDPNKGFIHKLVSGEKSYYPHVKSVQKQMSNEGLQWLVDINKSHVFLSGNHKIKRILPHLTMYWKQPND